ncbi:hypothetical protein [Pedobacter metabolipauper]|uniref:Glycosyl transferase family 2 n=1 Tax=Pedobacter metabolipauper TaxID=425513 RepID=A0A4R6T0M6_9SPHI|nr:hypothetical protein [Pedobacter metabolipauper]TDQ10365.1 hypothetical protein ATK78_2531 [Pedobacter metabolipauper]
MIIFIYAVLVFLVLRFSVSLFNFMSNPKLGHYGSRFNEKVSIIVSLEGGEMDAQLNSIEDQDYTYTELIFRQPGERMETVAEKATGDYLLFIDANVVLERGLIHNMIYRMNVFKLDLLSVIPNRKFKGLLAWCIYPVIDFVPLNLFPLRLARLSSLQAYAMVDQSCLFFDAASYRQNSWNKKSAVKYRTEVLLANKLVYTIGDSLNWTKVSKQTFKKFSNTILAAVFYLAFVVAGPIVIFLNLDPVFMVLPIGLIFMSRIMISFLTGQHPVYNVLLHPLQMISLVLILIKSIWDQVFTLDQQKYS